MLYKLIYFFHAELSWLNVFRYITFRTILSSLTALVVCFVFGGWVIRKLKAMQVGQQIRDDGPPDHQSKAGTPTMGGCLILPTIAIATLLGPIRSISSSGSSYSWSFSSGSSALPMII